MPYCCVKNNMDFKENILFSVIPLIRGAKIYLAQFIWNNASNTITDFLRLVYTEKGIYIRQLQSCPWGPVII